MKIFNGWISSISSNVSWGANGGSCQISVVEDPDLKDQNGNPLEVEIPPVGSYVYIRVRAFYFGGILQRWSYKEDAGSGKIYDIVIQSPAAILDGIQVILSGFNGVNFSALYGQVTEDGSSRVFSPAFGPQFTNQIYNVYNVYAHEENYSSLNDIIDRVALTSDGYPFYFGVPVDQRFSLENEPTPQTYRNLLMKPYGHDTLIARLGEDTGGIYGRFGNSNINDAGFPAVRALQIIQQISNDNSLYGSPANFNNNLFSLNFNEIIPLVNPNLRLTGPVQSVSSILQECADASGFDYYPELRPTFTVPDPRYPQNPEWFIPRPYEDGGSGNGVIYIRPVLKKPQINSRALQDYAEIKRNEGRLVSMDVGQEYSAPVTQRLIVGGPATRYSIIPMQSANGVFSKITSVWGKTANNRYIIDPTLFNPIAIYNNPLHRVPIILDEYSSLVSYFASIFELRMATGGKDCWETFKIFETIFGVEFNGFNDLNSCPWIGKSEFTLDLLELLRTGYASGIDLEPTSAEYIKRNSTEKIIPINENPEDNISLPEFSDKIYAAVSRVANNFYGRGFALELTKFEPGIADDNSLAFFNNVRFTQRDLLGNPVDWESQWEISDAAFVDSFPFADANFYDEYGRLKNGVAWPSNPKADYSSLGSNWAITPDGGIGSPDLQVNKNIYWEDLSGEGFTRPYVLLTAPQIKFIDGITTPDFGLSVLTQLFTGVWLPPQTYLSGGQNMQIAIPPAITYPTSFGLAEKSNTYSWGPWWAWSGGPPAKAEVVFDDKLVPETFGDTATLDQAAFALCNLNLAQSNQNETGSIEVIGEASFNLADRLNASGPYISSIDLNISIDGERTTYKFNNWTPEFGKMTRSNIERIANARKGAIALAQRTRSEIQKRPLPNIEFQKSDFGELAQRNQRPAPNMIHSFINQLGAANL